jgi:hypothetical protein
MFARDCTLSLDVVQHNVLGLSNYSRSDCTSRPASGRQDGLNYLIADSCSVGESQPPRARLRGDSGDDDRTLAHMLLEKLAWTIETIAPGSGQEKS